MANAVVELPEKSGSKHSILKKLCFLYGIFNVQL